MISVNKVTLIGNLTKDPEIKTTANGRMARLSIATNNRYRDKETNEIVNKAQFHEVVIFNEHFVGTAESYLRKGSQCMVEGSLEHRSYEDSDGNRKYVSEVIIRAFGGELQLGARPEASNSDDSDNGSYNNSGNDRGNNNNNRSNNNNYNNNNNNADDMDDDDIPF